MVKTFFLRGGQHIPPEHESLVGVAEGMAAILENLRIDGLEKDVRIILEGALTGIAIVTERHQLHEPIADLMEDWAKDLRSHEPVIMKIEGTV